MLFEYLVDISDYLIEDTEIIKKEIDKHFSEQCNLIRKESIISKKLLCDVLKSEYNLDDFTVRATDSGKLYIANSSIHFNISHSGDYIMLVIGDCKIGCDIQMLEEYKERVAKRFFTENEVAELEKSHNKALDFTKIWTLKESILKYHGSGISGGLDKYDFAKFINSDQFEAYDLRFVVNSNNKFVWTVCFEKGDILLKHSDIK